MIILKGILKMKRNKECLDAIEKAKKNIDDIKARKTDAIGFDSLEFIDTFLTPDEIAESDLRVALIGELIKARTEQGIAAYYSQDGKGYN